MLAHLKRSENWKMPARMQRKSGSDQGKFVSLKSKLVLELVVAISCITLVCKSSSQADYRRWGIRTHGDIAKSVRFGATMVMIGSLFAGHEESPGETKVENGVVLKEYFGSASEFQKGKRKRRRKKSDPLQRFFERYFG